MTCFLVYAFEQKYLHVGGILCEKMPLNLYNYVSSSILAQHL